MFLLRMTSHARCAHIELKMQTREFRYDKRVSLLAEFKEKTTIIEINKLEWSANTQPKGIY